jgi:RNA polymerase sigma factor (sigma-70 family)
MLTLSIDAGSEMKPDSELIRAFATCGDEDAFRELTQRHGPTVYCSCLRILNDQASAEDATQAVFMFLAQKAKGLTGHASLGGWLYKTAVLAAREMRRNVTVRRQHEARARAIMERIENENSRAEQEAKWNSIRPQLDEFLAALPEPQRDALVLRYFEKKSEAEIAEALGCPVKTASSRIARALAKLRDNFRKCGISITAAMLPLLLDRATITPLPPGAILKLRLIEHTAAPIVVRALVLQLSRTLLIMKLKAALVVLVLLLVCTGSAAMVLRPAWVRNTRSVEQLSNPSASGASASMPKRATAREYTAAVAAIHAGDIATLTKLLDEWPDVVKLQAAGVASPYSGYFGRATLLHHVAGNPVPDVVPKNAVRIARLLLDRGAAVDAKTVGGPEQPNDIGWTPFGLVATSLHAREAGVHIELMRLLASRGADIDCDDGTPLIAALFYGEAEAAKELTRMKARLDVRAAAALGDTDALQNMFNADGTLRPEGRGLSRYPGRDKGEKLSDTQLVTEAMAMANRYKQQAAVLFLKQMLEKLVPPEIPKQGDF